ncbi:MAG: hypothetical protein K6357_05025, partial [Elusimicrobiota bacterium]
MKKYIFISLFPFLFEVFSFSEIRIKTVEFNFGGYYSSTNLGSATQYNFPARFIKLPENSKVIRSAWIEYAGLAVSAANVNPLVIYFDAGTVPQTARFTSTRYTTQSSESIVLSAKADVTSVVSAQVNNLSSGVNFACGIKITGPTSNIHTVKLYITYEYDDNSPLQVKTVRFPLYSDWSNKIASYKNPKAPGTSSFQYYVDLPDLNQIYQQWFEITGFKRRINTTAGRIYLTIDGVNYEPTMYIDSSLGDSFYFRYISSSTVVPGFSTGTLQTVNIYTVNDPIHFLGGEVVITYEFLNSADEKVNTIRKFVGQSAAGTSQSVFNTKIFLNEEDITPLEVYAKINGSNDGTATSTSFSVVSSLGGYSLQTSTYSIYYAGALISDWKFIYSLNSAINSFSNGVLFSSTISANTTAGGYGIELFITYKYKNDKAHTTNYGVFGGNNTAIATTYNYTNVPLFWVESGSSKVVQSGYVVSDIVAANLNGDQRTRIAFNSNTPLTMTHRTINESPAMFQLYENLSQINPSTNAFTINYTNASSRNSIFNGLAYINYLYTPPPNLPYNLVQKRDDTGYEIPVSSWINTNSVSFYAMLSSSKTYDNLALSVELKPNSAAFDESNLSTSSFTTFNRYTSTYVVVSISSSSLVEGLYKWRARSIGDGGKSDWIKFAAPSFGVDLTDPAYPPMAYITPADNSAFNFSGVNFLFESVEDNLSGTKNYELILSTDENFSPIYFSSKPISPSAYANLNEGKYFWKVRVYDNAGNIGLWSSTRSFITDITLPEIIDNQSGDDIWISSNSRQYDVDFEDSLSYLNKFQIKITSGPNQTGTVIYGWGDVVTNINQPSYTGLWTIPQDIWDLIPSGTSYISVKVYDNANNVSISTDVFYVLKDTISPTVPVLSLPVNGSSVNVMNVSFSWNASVDSLSGVMGYEIVISTDNN